MSLMNHGILWVHSHHRLTLGFICCIVAGIMIVLDRVPLDPHRHSRTWSLGANEDPRYPSFCPAQGLDQHLNRSVSRQRHVSWHHVLMHSPPICLALFWKTHHHACFLSWQHGCLEESHCRYKDMFHGGSSKMLGLLNRVKLRKVVCWFEQLDWRSALIHP